MKGKGGQMSLARVLGVQISCRLRRSGDSKMTLLESSVDPRVSAFATPLFFGFHVD